MAHAWKACWVNALGGSNPPSSAPVTSANAKRAARGSTTEPALVSVLVSLVILDGSLVGPQQTADLVRYLPADRVRDVLVARRNAVLDQPMMPITVRSGTPRTSSTVAAVCRASCNRPSRTPASFSSAFQRW